MSDSGTVASECDKLSKRRRRARHGTCDGESLVKPLDRNASDTLLLTQDAQGGPIHSDDAEQKPVKKRKRSQRVDQAPDERESTVAITTGTTDREQLDTERFEFNFMQGKEANAAKRAKRKKMKKSINGAAGKMEDVIVRPVLGQKEALEYLHTWHADKESWSFKKKAQYWLLQNIYKKEMVCVCVCVSVCVRACVRACVCVCWLGRRMMR